MTSDPPAEEGVASGRDAVSAEDESRDRPRSRRRALWAAVSVAIAMALFIAVLATRPPAVNRLVDSPLLGEPAPDLGGTALDGSQYRLADRRGQWVVVNFFATWCVPCRREHPDLLRFHRQHQVAGDADVVGVVYDDSPDAVRSFLREEGGEWPMLADPQGKIALDFGVAGVPESFVVSPDGVVVAKIVGGVRADGLEELLSRARQGVPLRR